MNLKSKQTKYATQQQTLVLSTYVKLVSEHINYNPLINHTNNEF